MGQIIILIVIGVLVLLYVGIKMYRLFSSKNKGCNCEGCVHSGKEEKHDCCVENDKK